ncbi:HET-domain-containing protein [Thozetella sp. PMI_491]|nr:HET-domain-containing protein [Thozetella sp. PMI_491]
MDPAKFPVYSNHIGVRLSHNFLSENTVSFFDMWLDGCKDGHTACNTYYEKKWRFPTRLIDVGDAFHEPRLVVEPDPEEQVGYATLSYCWGKSFNSRTTLANLEQHKSSIPMHELSPTLRQAIQLARHLNIQYLWADSLCIIQDSKEDWDAESVRMAEIYRNSLFTIAAPRARSSMEGIFPDATERRRPVQITSGRTPVPLFIDSVPLGWDRCVEEDTLSERGWVLQERLLSCRTLFVGDQQLFWECKTMRASQHQYSNLAGEEDIVKAPESVFNKIPEIKEVDKLALQSLRDDSEREYMSWYQVISVYSIKTLTFPADKLPAVAGIAQAFGHPEDIYVAGTWLTDWLGGLLWEPVKPRTLKLPHGIRGPRAPSWSWASLDGEIAFPMAAPDYDFVNKLRGGTLGKGSSRVPAANTGNAAPEALEATQNVEEFRKEEQEVKAESVVESTTSVPMGSENQAEADTAKTIIEIGLAGLDLDGPRPAGLFAELHDVEHQESDFMGRQTEVALTLRGHAEWVDARSSTGKPDPPSTYNEWTGTYDDFTGNWIYSLDQEKQEEPFRCLRFVMVATERNCWALLLKQRPDSRFERIGTAHADSFMVDFTKLVETPRETIVLC